MIGRRPRTETGRNDRPADHSCTTQISAHYRDTPLSARGFRNRILVFPLRLRLSLSESFALATRVAFSSISLSAGESRDSRSGQRSRLPSLRSRVPYRPLTAGRHDSRHSGTTVRTPQVDTDTTRFLNTTARTDTSGEPRTASDRATRGDRTLVDSDTERRTKTARMTERPHLRSTSSRARQLAV